MPQHLQPAPVQRPRKPTQRPTSARIFPSPSIRLTRHLLARVEKVSGTFLLTIGARARIPARCDDRYGPRLTDQVARAYVESLEGSRSGKVIEASAFETG
jgi:hypothetical protein